jgi:polyribonucleotide nucleotidyltransferase
MAVDIAERVHTVAQEIEGRTLSLETGRIAEQAMGAVVVRYGDTMVLATVVGEKEPKEGLDFFPLTVDYEEKMYAAGKIPGGFIKREGRPTEAAILAARLTDRPLRPLFPKGYRAEVQIINTVLSADQENDPSILSIIGASAALMLSPIPWDGPVGAARIGMVDGKVVINPSLSSIEDSELDMVVAGTDDAIMMVEGEAGEISEEQLLDAISRAHEEIKKITALQQELRQQAGAEKWSFEPPKRDEALVEAVRSYLGDRLREETTNPDKIARMEGTSELKQDVLNHFAEAPEGEQPKYSAKDVSETFDALLKNEVRSGILSNGTRPDGRTPDQIRPIWSEVGYLPRTHGSAIFTRGQTQVLTTVTLGSTAEEQRLDSISPDESKRYIHHYNFPPFSVGEVRRLRGPSRRDIGHGALAERALLAVIPNEAEFPYTMRVVSEVVSSNGSSSMASVCGSTMALMDAGVPIKKPVAGVAMGLVSDPNSDKFTILTDIQGIEDALGDMDFKVAGTADGVTAIQMDIKVKGITPEIMRQALQQAHAGRIFILGKMAETIAQPREHLSRYAPRVERIKINPEKIGLIIGPGGKNIRAMQEETGTKIDIDDDGTVSISSADPKGAQAAIERIQGLTHEVKVERGDIYTGKIVSIMPYGAFVEILPGKDGLAHISELSEDPAVRLNKVDDLFNVGDEITVMVTDVAPNGKVSLSRRAALTGELPEPKPERGPRPGGGGRGGDRGPRHGDGHHGGDRGHRGDGGGFNSRPGDSRQRPSLPRQSE